MYKLKVKKGVKVELSNYGITLDGNREYSQEELKSLYDLGLSQFIEYEDSRTSKKPK